MTRWVAVLAAVALAGCSETQPFHGDVTFSAEERAAIESGNEWIATQIGRDAFIIVWDRPHAAPPDSLSIVRDDSAGLGDWGHSGVLTLSPRRPGWTEDALGTHYRYTRLGVLAAHEFGHEHGLGHHDGPGVMYPWIPETMVEPVWTPEDQAACERDHVCVPK